MQLSVRAAASYDLPAETFMLLMVEPRLIGAGHRVLKERLSTTTTIESQLRADLQKNVQRTMLAPAGEFSYEFEALIDVQPNTSVPEDAVEHPPKEIPADAMAYTLPSRYCQSDLLARMAFGEFGDMPPGGRRVMGIADWVRRRVEYRYGTTDSLTSAFDTATERVGVCRDFAHLTIAFCRALGVPARYVSAYALDLDPPDYHGIAQVYLGGAWHNVDATFDGVRPALVPIAIGRDAADVAMTTLWGLGTLRSQAVEVERVDPPDDEAPQEPA